MDLIKKHVNDKLKKEQLEAGKKVAKKSTKVQLSNAKGADDIGDFAGGSTAQNDDYGDYGGYGDEYDAEDEEDKKDNVQSAYVITAV